MVFSISVPFKSSVSSSGEAVVMVIDFVTVGDAVISLVDAYSVVSGSSTSIVTISVMLSVSAIVCALTSFITRVRAETYTGTL